MKKGKSFLVLTALFTFLFTACELGMGASPDLEAPVIKITSLESGGTIIEGSELFSAVYCKREIVIKGNASDNEKVQSVSVEIKWEGENDYTFFSDCNVKGDKWTGSLVFPKEGVASLKFTAKDAKANYSTKSSQIINLFIDDSAPVGNAWYIDRKVNGMQYSLKSLEYLKALNLDDSENKDAAQNVAFSIRGNFNDTMGIKNVYIELFDEEGNKLCKIDKTESSGLYAPEFIITSQNLSALDNNRHYIQVKYSAEDVVTVPESNKAERMDISGGWFIWWPDGDKPRIVPSTAVSAEDNNIHINIKTTLSLTIFDDDTLEEAYCALLTDSEYNALASDWKTNPFSILSATSNDNRKGSFVSSENNTTRDIVRSLKSPDEPDTSMYLVAYAKDKPYSPDGSQEAQVSLADLPVQVTDDKIPMLFITSPKNNTIPVLTMENDDANAYVTISGETSDTTGCSYLEFVWVPDSISDKRSAAESWLNSINSDEAHLSLAQNASVKVTTQNQTGMKLWSIPLSKANDENGFKKSTFSFTLDMFKDFKNNSVNERDKDKYFLAKLTRLDGNFKYLEYRLNKDSELPLIKAEYPSIDMQNISDKADYTLSFYAQKTSGLPIATSKYKIERIEGNKETELDGNLVNSKYQATISKAELEDFADKGIKPKYRFTAEDIFGNKNSRQYTLIISDLPALQGFSSTSSAMCKKGDVIDVTATFSKTVGIIESEQANLKLKLKGIEGKDYVEAEYAGGSGTTTLHFTYTVAEGDLSNGLLLYNSKPLVTDGITSLAADIVKIEAISDSDFDAKGIKVDGKSPKIANNGITLSSTGTDSDNIDGGITYLREGTSLIVNVTTDEKVTVQGSPKFKLTNTEGTVELPFAGITVGDSSSTITFSKTIASKDKNGRLKYNPSDCIIDYDSIKDSYGNSLALVSGSDVTKNYFIDTTPPAAPAITNADDSQLSSDKYPTSVEFKLIAATGDTIRKSQYSLDGGSTWKDYSDTVTIDESRLLTSRSIDYAGNISDPLTPISIDINNTFPGYTLECTNPDGYYKPGTVLTFKVSFGAKVNIAANAAAKIYLTGANTGDIISSGAYASLYQTDDTSATFKYTVQKTDQFSLKVASGRESNSGVHLDGITDLYGNSDDTGLSQAYTRAVVCDGVIPYIKTMTPGTETASESNIFNGGNVITIEFNEPVQKGEGNIILRQVKDWAIPPVISGPDFNTILNAIPSNYSEGGLTGSTILYMDEAEDVQDVRAGIKLENNYYHGTGQFIGPYKKSSYGIKEDGSPNTAPQYVLDVNMGIWETDTAHYYGTTFAEAQTKDDLDDDNKTPVELTADNSTTITANNIRNTLEAAGYHQRVLDVTSASVSTSDNKTYTISFPKGLTGSAALADGRRWELVIEKGAFLDYTENEFGSKYTSNSATEYTTTKTQTDSIMQKGGTLTDELGTWGSAGRGRTSAADPVVLIQTTNGQNFFWSDKVATPVIRIDRYSYGIGIKQADENGDLTTAIADDNAVPTAYVRVRIDCETKDAVIEYGKSITSNSRNDTGATDDDYNSAKKPKEIDTSNNPSCYSYITDTSDQTDLETMTLENTYTLNTFFAAGNGDYTKSCKDYIVAKGTKTGFTPSDRGKECAFQTVVRFYKPRNDNGTSARSGNANGGQRAFSIRGTTGWGGEPTIVPFPLRDSRPGSCYLRRCYNERRNDTSTENRSEDYYWVSYEVLVESSFSGYSWHHSGYYDWCKNWGYMHPGEFTICVNMKNWG